MRFCFAVSCALWGSTSPYLCLSIISRLHSSRLAHFLILTGLPISRFDDRCKNGDDEMNDKENSKQATESAEESRIMADLLWQQPLMALNLGEDHIGLDVQRYDSMQI